MAHRSQIMKNVELGSPGNQAAHWGQICDYLMRRWGALYGWLLNSHSVEVITPFFFNHDDGSLSHEPVSQGSFPLDIFNFISILSSQTKCRVKVRSFTRATSNLTISESYLHFFSNHDDGSLSHEQDKGESFPFPFTSILPKRKIMLNYRITLMGSAVCALCMWGRASRVSKRWREGMRQALACRTKLSFAGWRPDDAAVTRLVNGASSLKELNMWVELTYTQLPLYVYVQKSNSQRNSYAECCKPMIAFNFLRSSWSTLQLSFSSKRLLVEIKLALCGFLSSAYLQTNSTGSFLHLPSVFWGGPWIWVKEQPILWGWFRAKSILAPLDGMFITE